MRLRLWAITLVVVMLFSLLSGCGCGKKGLSPGDPSHYSVNDVKFTLRYAPGATFPTGLEDDGTATVEHGFWIGETEVTYELWYELKLWAEEKGYKFANRGGEGGRLGKIGQEPSESKKHPVARINWYDAIVWCNALSEYLEYEPVYTYQGEVYRDATNRSAGNNITVERVIGFRLPTADEWELAARYKGRDRSHGAIEYPEGSKNYWTPGNYASGAKGPVTDEDATMAAAWYKENSSIEGQGTSTHDVGQKPAGGNGLNLFDMSGNVFEWLHSPKGGVRGGCYYREQHGLGYVSQNVTSLHSTYPNLGFRLVLPWEVGSQGDDDPGDDDEILFPINTLVEVEWEGKWYDARVLEVEGGFYYITYVGFDDSWNEWVGNTRIRERSKGPVIASVKDIFRIIAPGTVRADLDLPTEVEVVLRDGSSFTAGVEWDSSSYDHKVTGLQELSGRLTGLPVNVANPDNIRAEITLRVRTEGGATSLLRRGGETDIEGLLFYIDNDDGIKGYYFGTNPTIDLTHVVIENDLGFSGMIIFNEDMYPIQWVLPNLTISVIVPKNQAFDPKEAIHAFLLEDEQVNITLNLELNDLVSQVLDKMPQFFGPESTNSGLRDRLEEMGWLSKTIAEVTTLASTPHEVAIASSLSLAWVSLGIHEQLEALEEGDSSSCNGPLEFTLLCTGNISGSDVTQAVAGQLMGKFGPVYDIWAYLDRISSGYYDGEDISGPAVTMLLCKGASCVPGVCHSFYMPASNVSACVARCRVSLACFTDICHPQRFSVEDAKNLRQP